VSRPSGPVFNPAAVRDALGLVRLLWAVENGNSFGPEEDDFDAHLQRMNLLTETGKTLVRCLDLGRGGPDTVGGRAALWQSIAAMDALVAALHEPLVQLAHARVIGRRPPKETERDEKRRAREKRG
jgi:hypothetical protein